MASQRLWLPNGFLHMCVVITIASTIINWDIFACTDCMAKTGSDVMDLMHVTACVCMSAHSCPHMPTHSSTCAQMCSLTCTCTCAHVCNCALVCGHSNVHVHAHTTVAGSNGYQVPGLRIGPIILFYSLQWVGHLQIDRTCSHSTSIQYNQEHVLKVGSTDSS